MAYAALIPSSHSWKHHKILKDLTIYADALSNPTTAKDALDRAGV
jgi:hypothetical protein